MSASAATAATPAGASAAPPATAAATNDPVNAAPSTTRSPSADAAEVSRSDDSDDGGADDALANDLQQVKISSTSTSTTLPEPSPAPPTPSSGASTAAASSDPVAIPAAAAGAGAAAKSSPRTLASSPSLPKAVSPGVIARDMASPSSSSISSPSSSLLSPPGGGGGGATRASGMQSRSPGGGAAGGAQRLPSSAAAAMGGPMSAGAFRNRVGGLAAMGSQPQQAQRLPPSLQAKMDALQRKNAPGGGGGPNGGGAGASPGGAGGAGGRDPSSMSALLAAAAAGATRQAPQPPRIPPGVGGGPAAGGLAARRAAAAAAGAAGNGGKPPGPALPASGLSGARPSITGIAGPSGQRSGPLGGVGGGSPAMGPGGGLSKRRPGMGMTLSAMGASANGPAAGGAANGSSNGAAGASQQRTDGKGQFGDFGAVIDPTGRLNFNNKAILTSEGVDFSNGQSFKINMNEMVLEEELGKGNYGTVQRVYHRPTKVVMAMKEIRLELDQSKLNAIIMELDILHRAVAPEIVEFYGAFLIESCVYYCMEFMDAGSLDQMHGNGVPEDVLGRITKSVVKGLGFLKDSLQIMHRDVKPTNILVNTKGQVKLCDFGVSGQLEKSLAKTNIGCQSYMAPERIKGGGGNDVSTYTVASDVWSVGLSIIEVAQGSYPYPPETYSNVFAQLTSIVHGPSPTLPEQYSATAQDFVAQCLLKQPEMRPTYGQLLKHKWMLEDAERDVDMVGWVAAALKARAARRSRGQPVSSSAPEGAPPPQPDARVQ